MEFPIDLPIGEKFIRLRKAEGLSQRAFADIVEISHATIGHIESGRNKKVGIEDINKIAKHPRFSKYAIWLLFDHPVDEALAKGALEILRGTPGYVPPPEGE